MFHPNNALDNDYGTYGTPLSGGGTASPDPGTLVPCPYSATPGSASYDLLGQETAGTEDLEDSSGSESSDSTDSEELMPSCSVCLQSQCVCHENGTTFDPSLFQLPHIALLMQQSGANLHQNSRHSQDMSGTSRSIPHENLPINSRPVDSIPPLNMPGQNPLSTTPSPDNSSTSSTPPDSPSSAAPHSPPFICQVCQEWFVLQDKLILHLVVNHSMVYCKFCTRLFRSQEEHTMCSAHRGTQPCPLCRHNFRTDSSTAGHELARHQSTAHDLHTCPLCATTVRTRPLYLEHLNKRHQVLERCQAEAGLVAELADGWSFLCRLCSKTCPRAELFGHFHSLHRLSLTCLIELLHRGAVYIPIAGYQAAGEGTGGGAEGDSQQRQECCMVCGKPYTEDVPRLAHEVFCCGLAYCPHCARCFPSGLARELHVVREHAGLPCLACGQTFPAETSLAAHHARAHAALRCPCCDLLVPSAAVGEHLMSVHSCSAVPSNEVLSRLAPSDSSPSALCCNLCPNPGPTNSPGAVFMAQDVQGVVRHLTRAHSMPWQRALALLCRPSVHGTLSVGPPGGSQESWTNSAAGGGATTISAPMDEEENILVPQVDLHASSDSSGEEEEEEDEDEAEGDNLMMMAEEVCSSDEGDGAAESASEEQDERGMSTGPLPRSWGSPDVDPEDLDCVTDSSDEEDLEEQESLILRCELCLMEPAPTFFSPRQLCAHLFTQHKMHWDRRGHEQADAEYHCTKCGGKFSDRAALCRHRTSSHPVTPEDHVARCRFCTQSVGAGAAGAEERNLHMLRAHPDMHRNFYRCHLCQMLAASTSMLSRHLRSSHPSESSTEFSRGGVRIKCRVCLLLFPHVSAARAHFLAAHPAAMVYRCAHCGAHLKTRKTLKHHLKVVHSESRRRDCSACGKVLWSKRAYAIHFRMKHSKSSKVGFRCRICQLKFDSKEQRKLHYTLDHEGESPYHCADCGKGFASKSGMYGHRQLHTGAGVSKCEYCGKEFTRRDSYNEHLLIHNGPRHKCPHCPKEFVQRSNLVRHIRIHTGEKPYQCTFCDKRFSDKGACNSHIRVHTREETCSCPYCGQTFSKKQKLKYHIRKHTGEGLIECEICNKMFTNSFALKEHRVIHNRQTQVVCPQCGKGFNSEKYLQRHVAIVHEPSNAFSCPMCPKTFSQQARLKAHVMTHSGVKHIKCLLCDKAYSVRKSLRRHLMDKHEVSPEHPQYKRCFHAMSPEEAGLAVPRHRRVSPRVVPPAQPTPAGEGTAKEPALQPSTAGSRKRRRVEQIVQSLQHAASSHSNSAELARIHPLVVNVPRAAARKRQQRQGARRRVVSQQQQQQARSAPRSPDGSRSTSSSGASVEGEGLNLSLVKGETTPS